MTPDYAYIARGKRVVDGDTLDLIVDLGFRMSAAIRVRLAGVDTPEVYGVKKDSEEHARGVVASEFTRQWVKNSGDVVYVKTTKSGKYGRWIAEVFSLDGESLNNAIKRQGW